MVPRVQVVWYWNPTSKLLVKMLLLIMLLETEAVGDSLASSVSPCPASLTLNADSVTLPTGSLTLSPGISILLAEELLFLPSSSKSRLQGSDEPREEPKVIPDAKVEVVSASFSLSLSSSGRMASSRRDAKGSREGDFLAEEAAVGDLTAPSLCENFENNGLTGRFTLDLFSSLLVLPIFSLSRSFFSALGENVARKSLMEDLP